MQAMTNGNQGVELPLEERLDADVGSEDSRLSDGDEACKDSTEEASAHTASRGWDGDDQGEEAGTETDLVPCQVGGVAIGLPPVAQVVAPFSDDVIGGRGRGQNEHLGNQGYRRVIRANCRQYRELVSNADKTEFTRRIVAQVCQTRRFLKRVRRDEYVEMTEEEARQKVGQVR
jgi:hypothetical protein